MGFDANAGFISLGMNGPLQPKQLAIPTSVHKASSKADRP